MSTPEEQMALKRELERLSQVFGTPSRQPQPGTSGPPEVGMHAAPTVKDSHTEGSMNTMTSDNEQIEPDRDQRPGEKSAGAKPVPPRRNPANSTDAGGDSAPNAGAARADAPENTITSRDERDQYLLGRRTGELLPQGVEPLGLEVFTADNLNKIPGVEIVKTLSGPNLGVLALGGEASEPIHVARIHPEHAQRLHQALGHRIVVERDEHITLMFIDPPLIRGTNEHPGIPGIPVYRDPGDSPYPAIPGLPGYRNPGLLMPLGDEFNANLTIRGNDGPVAGASVVLTGSTYPFPVQGVTDANGQVTLTLYGESGETLQSLIVRPHDSYYSLYIQRPNIIPDQNNTVMLTGLDRIYPNFPNQQVIEWGQRAMNLDKLPSNLQGQGARVAIIDSGVAVGHPDLHAKEGYDFVAESDQTWSQDTVGHGSHCAGIIAGTNNQFGIRGFAPQADVYAFKIFPGGRFSSLIDALNRCIEFQVDVVNLSLGSAQPSDLVKQTIAKAKQAGVACIVAAGNSAGPVQYPAAFEDVLAVAALGRVDAFPQNSYNITQVYTGSTGNAGTSPPYFSANFSCFGPEVGVAAPGVAIVSTVPPDKYATMDGTSMAAPHVTGLATLIVAHHPDFQPHGPFGARNAQRVERLFQIIKQSAQPLNFGDPNRVGVGMPDSLRALPMVAPSSRGVQLASVSDVGVPSMAGAVDVTSQLLEALRRIESIIQRQAGS